ncbi:MAG: hypothetical protein HYZ53_10815 [Planctomycetes bacterium]|nr:hypothetical protein [Planctomycetota bacterium]
MPPPSLVLVAVAAESDRERIRRTLDEAELNWRVVTASTGPEAVQRVFELDLDALILDIALADEPRESPAPRAVPGAAGLGALRALDRVLEARPWLPVVLWSEQELDATWEGHALRFGVFDLLAADEPNLAFKLVNRVRHAVELTGGRRPAPLPAPPLGPTRSRRAGATGGDARELRRALLPDPEAIAEAVREGALDLERFLEEARYAVLDVALAESSGVGEVAARLLSVNPHTLRRHVRDRPRRLRRNARGERSA